MIGKLSHVAIVVPDLAAAAARYRDVLGARVSAPLALPEHGVTTVFVEQTLMEDLLLWVKKIQRFQYYFNSTQIQAMMILGVQQSLLDLIIRCSTFQTIHKEISIIIFIISVVEITVWEQ